MSSRARLLRTSASASALSQTRAVSVQVALFIGAFFLVSTALYIISSAIGVAQYTNLESERDRINQQGYYGAQIALLVLAVLLFILALVMIIIAAVGKGKFTGRR